jgi:TolB-like protein
VIPPVTEPSHEVFLSYASQDAEAARRICEALRAAGIEVWFDQSALRGGDVWDQAIRKQIKTCVLFIPVVSRHTHERDEGYFRLEWKLAVDRSHLMTTNKAFLLPVVVDDTREDDENVPDRFRDIHWTRLPGGETSPAFVERVRRLVSPEPSHRPTTTDLPATPGSATTPLARGRVATLWRSKQALPMILAVVVAGALAYIGIDKFWFSKYQASPPTRPAAPASAAPAAFAPPPHSIAVLPFVNMSGDKEQEYFSDGLTEEILNSLVRINELQVSARTSSFSFKGRDIRIGIIARELNVGSILEGSVRRSGHTVRVTAQLNNAVTGFHLWSQTYDRDLSDVLKLQTDIANAVANALKVTLLGDVGAKIELGGTHTPAAFDAYLRASKMYFANEDAAGKNTQAAIAEYTEAIRLDPNYALARADRSIALAYYAEQFAKGPAIHEYLSRAMADANKAVTLAPDLARGHFALGYLARHSLNLTLASQETERALALAPGDARVLRDYGRFAVELGHTDAGLAAAHRAVALDPLNVENLCWLGDSLRLARHYKEALAAFMNAKALEPNDDCIGLAWAYWGIGDFEAARAVCEKSSDQEFRHLCLAIGYEKLGRHSDAQTALASWVSRGDADAVIYAIVYAQWGQRAKALEWLETALRLRDPGLVFIKTEPLLDPLRQEPRFQAIQRQLQFPQ